jgi:uncharacterized Fe-S cluster protein YjdI
MAKLQTYPGDGFEVTFDPNVCSHSAECLRGLPAVFDARVSPWIRPGAASAAAIEAQVVRCPSGALKIVRAAAPSPSAAAAGAPSTVQLTADGPLLLAGEFEIRGPDGTVLFKGQKAALCRCGHSKNKPFCDGSHRPAGFKG